MSQSVEIRAFLAHFAGRNAMSLEFPNPSRSIDKTRQSVRFWGHDGALEISFFVEFAALQGLSQDQPESEADLLRAFDSYRSRIHDAAGRVYARVSKGTFVCVVHAKDI
ncbi:MAG: DUF1488 domain-containing protein [Hyphomicrobiaceae bacterium]